MTRKQTQPISPSTPPKDLRTDPDRETGELGQEGTVRRKPLEKPRQEQRQNQNGQGQQQG